MTKATQVFIIVAAIILVAGGIWWLTTQTTDEDTPRTQQSEPTANEESETIEPQPDADAVTPALTITYTNEGFDVPGSSIEAGEPILIVNQSDNSLDFASDPHPQHTDNSELNANVIAPGQEETFTVSQAGTWGFHNHFNPSHTGSVTVTD